VLGDPGNGCRQIDGVAWSYVGSDGAGSLGLDYQLLAGGVDSVAGCAECGWLSGGRDD
jgi:hypothetical protein